MHVIRSYRRRSHKALILAVVAVVAALFSLATPAAAAIPDRTRFYVPRPNPEALRQIVRLTIQGRRSDADLIRSMITTATGVWVESGSAGQAERQVGWVTHVAAAKKTVPLLVLYNIPFRDCAQYSAGGATSVAEYKAWIDGVVRGIGRRPAVIALEPDGLGIVPWYTMLTARWSGASHRRRIPPRRRRIDSRCSTTQSTGSPPCPTHGCT